jgi:hypothetical protein
MKRKIYTLVSAALVAAGLIFGVVNGINQSVALKAAPTAHSH